jgi:hypothetical protein
MSFEAYLDAIEVKTGRTPRQLIAEARERGLSGPQVKAGSVIDWLSAEYGLGRGHAMAIVHIIRNGPKAPGSSGPDPVWLDGKASRPLS